MSSPGWKEEKDRLAALTPEQREKRNAEKNAVPVVDVPTWAAYYKIKTGKKSE